METDEPAGALQWTAGMVSNSGGEEAAAVRNYLEQSLVREALRAATAGRPVRTAVDVGAGFGRLSRVLGEFAGSVFAVERDRRLLHIGQLLNPEVTFIPVETLAALPLASASADFAQTFTVLQHLPDGECRQVIAEIRRVVRAGHVLLVEETDESLNRGPFAPETGDHVSRSVETYASWLAPWRLVKTWPRRVEPSYPRQDTGTAMLFASAKDECAGPAPGDLRLELGCGTNPTPGYTHHDRVRHSAWVDVAHDLNELPWPWPDGSCAEVLGLDVFEHLHLMPEQWLRECHRLLRPGGLLKLRVPVFGTPWHLIDPTHVRGFHPLNFDYFVEGRELHRKFGHYYFDFAFRDGRVEVEDNNIAVTLTR